MKTKLLIETLKRNPGERAPFWFMRQAGRYLPEYREIRGRCKGFLDLCYTPELAAEVTMQPVQRFGVDAAILFSDILVVPHALGAEVTFVEGEGPKLKPFEEKDFSKLSLSRVEAHIQPVLETVRRVSAALDDKTALIGFAGAPWTVACYMIEGGGSREFDKVRSFAIKQPEVFTRLITLLEDATILYLAAQISAGAEVIQLFDSWAGILPPSEFLRWVCEPAKRIVQALNQAFPDVPIIGFPRLAGTKYAEYCAFTGVDGISVDHTVNMQYFFSFPAVPQGNLDPLILAHDLPRALEETRQILDMMQEGPFIFNLGHGMLPQTPVEHVAALCGLLKGV